ncbi:MAG: hypothetical protein RRB13_07935 [bacterium]|nr:hypothetical protein [bacterium]
MNRFKTSLAVALSALVLAGCSSQGYLTHAVFEREDASYRELDLSMQKLYEEVADGNTAQQFNAVRSLRHLAKWADDPAKRQMAVRGLVFIAAYASDGDVRDKADSRVSAILTSGDVALAVEAIRAKAEIATGQFSLTLIDGTEEELILADEDERAEAVEFLKDHFGQVDSYLQYQTALAFADVLSAEPVCLKMGYKTTTREISQEIPNPALAGLTEANRPKGIPATIIKKSIVTEEDKSQMQCRKDDRAEQVEWKEDLIDDLDELLAYSDLAPEVSSGLLMAAASVAYVEDMADLAEQVQGLEDEGLFPQDRLPLLAAAANKLKGYHPDLYQGDFNRAAFEAKAKEQTEINENQPATAIAEQLEAKRRAEKEADSQMLASVRFAPKANLANPGAYLGAAFWLNNAATILDRQLFKPGSRYTQGPKPTETEGFTVPQEWIFYRGYDGSPTAKELKSILYYHMIDALNRGYLIENPRTLEAQFRARIDALAGAEVWEQERELALLSAAWPSLKAGGASFIRVATSLRNGMARNVEDRYLKTRYLLALVAALKAYPEQEKEVCLSLPYGDLAAQSKAFFQVQGYPAYAKPVQTKEDSLVENPKFCGQDLYARVAELKAPEMPKEEAATEATTEAVEPAATETPEPTGGEAAGEEPQAQ